MANSQDSSFVKALATARSQQSKSQESFSALFFKAYRSANPNKKLTSIFANASTKGRIASNDDDSKVIEVIDGEIENAIDRSFTILRNRLDQFGTSQPNIQRLPGTGRIQIEIPGADNPQRVRKLLQGVAKLEFWDVLDVSTLNNSLLAINDVLVKEAKSTCYHDRRRQQLRQNLKTYPHCLVTALKQHRTLLRLMLQKDWIHFKT